MGFWDWLFGGKKYEIPEDDGGPAGLLDAPPEFRERKSPAPYQARGKEREMPILKKDDLPVLGRDGSANINALLGKGSEFEGKLTFEGTVRIDGRFAGEIFSEETLVVGEGAKLKAEVNVGSLVLYGELVGNVRASHTVELHAPARLIGNIATPALMIESGVIFEGNSKMENIGAEKPGFIKKDVAPMADIRLAEKK
jgi:cytoskeletal protein CcmA (bactofilin family)